MHVFLALIIPTHVIVNLEFVYGRLMMHRKFSSGGREMDPMNVFMTLIVPTHLIVNLEFVH